MSTVEVAYTVSATRQLYLVLTGGLICGVVCAWSTCSETTKCNVDTVCIHDPLHVCTFTNRVSIYTDAAVVLTASAESLSGLLRGICSPGDRLQTNAHTGKAECVPFFPFPSAINHEIVDPSAPTASGRACGKWIDTGNEWAGVSRRGSYDNDAWSAEIRNVEDTETRSRRASSTGMSKFRAECEHTAAGGQAALRVAALLAYEHLCEYIEQTVVDRDGFLRALGYHMSHYCEGPAWSSVDFASGYAARLANGYLFSQGVLSSSLHLFQEPISVQSNAEDALAAIQRDYHARIPSNLTSTERLQVMIGASGDEFFRFHETVADTTLVRAAADYYAQSPLAAVSYLKGLAAFCSYEVYSTFSKYGPESSTYDTNEKVASEMTRFKATGPAAASLGRLATNRSIDSADASDLEESTRITLASVVGGGNGVGDPSFDCLAIMRAMFTDEVDAARFSYGVSEEFYAKLESMVLSVRVASGNAAMTPPLNETLTDVGKFAEIVSSAGVRMVGAPRGSWAGNAREIPRAALSSRDGMFVMLMKQARAQYKSNVVDSVAYNSSLSQCDHNPAWSALSWNAYAVRLGGEFCTVYFMGLTHRPLLDPLYDDSSLYSRGLFVFAHEFAHFSQLGGLLKSYTTPELQRLLHHYHAHTYSEAYADVFAAVTVLSIGVVSRGDFDIHHCQVWCTRQPWWYSPSSDTVHPVGNDRCNFLIRTLDEFFPTLGKTAT